jgi:hypothetical protein
MDFYLNENENEKNYFYRGHGLLIVRTERL